MRKLNHKKVQSIKDWNMAIYRGSKRGVKTSELWDLYYNLVDRKETGIYAGSGIGSRGLWACLAVCATDSNGICHPGKISEAIAYYRKHIH